jgi:hypothetical protein
MKVIICDFCEKAIKRKTNQNIIKHIYWINDWTTEGSNCRVGTKYHICDNCLYDMKSYIQQHAKTRNKERNM